MDGIKICFAGHLERYSEAITDYQITLFFSVEDYTVNVLGFADHMGSLLNILCFYNPLKLWEKAKIKPISLTHRPYRSRPQAVVFHS